MRIAKGALYEAITTDVIEKTLNAPYESGDGAANTIPLAKLLMQNPKFVALMLHATEAVKKGDPLVEVTTLLMTGVTLGVHLAEGVLEEVEEAENARA